MEKIQTRSKLTIPEALMPRFSSKITPYINVLLKMRYEGQRSVSDVVAWLKEQRCEVSERSYHNFMRRVLRSMLLKQAEQLGVDPSLLRAVRIRLKMPSDPRSERVAAGKVIARYDHRRHRRRLSPEPKRRPAVPPPPRPRQGEAPDPGQRPLLGVSAPVEPTPAEIAEFQRFNRTQLREVNVIATAKVRALTLDVYTNVEGRCFNIKTRQDYTPEEIQAQFGLTYAESQSLFRTIPDR